MPGAHADLLALTATLAVRWGHILLPDTSPIEIAVRGTLVYLVAFALLRIVFKREAGQTSLADVLVIVMLADAAQNAMADGYHSVSDGLLLVSVIVFWAWALDRLAFRFPRIERLVKPAALPLIKHGRMLRANMRRESITDRELWSMLRQQGVEDITVVKIARLEQNGRLSVITEPPAPNRTRQRVGAVEEDG